MNKEQWDYIGKEYLPIEECIMANRDVYCLWINPFNKKKRLILITDNSHLRLDSSVHSGYFWRGSRTKAARKRNPKGE